MRLHVETAGHGPALVLLHGFTGNAGTWLPLLPVLAEHFRVLAVDLPGHRYSPPPDGMRLPELADALVGILDRLGIARAHWLGYSMGGRAALHVALARPGRVERLILESASPGIADATARTLRAVADDALAATLLRDGLPAFVDAWAAQPLFATQARLPGGVRERERAVRLGNGATGLAAALRAFGPGVQAPLWDELAHLRPPTLLVVGADDPPYRVLAARMAARLPDAETVVVPDAGHATHLENPVAFAAATIDFLRRRAPRPA
ncbi:MAG: 2-succinyl-6-hydroxy-2,4-cyclohexadiene-1-carboxylate synthase [bacterium]|nr:2-succinyl-6-hydroxy-2,4-cyclohexadiene-1-carboxylate synthase [bacterium]